MVRYWVVGLALLFVLGCTEQNPNFCDAEEQCSNNRFCNLELNACEAELCTPGVATGCSGDGLSAVVCNATGQAFEEQACEFACNATRGQCNECDAGVRLCDTETSVDHLTICAADGTLEDSRDCLLGCRAEGDSCVDVDPSNGLAVDLDDIDRDGITVNLVLGEGYQVDSDGVILDEADMPIPGVDSRLVSQGGELPIRVYRVRSLSVEGSVSIIGANPVAFVSDRDIVIDGIISLFSGRITDRAQNICVGADPQTDNNDDSGGGGGGFGGGGGDGGDADGANGAAGGNSHGSQGLVPLVGGCNGGQGVGITAGGAGGGALQLVSRQTIRFMAAGGISAVGGGGGFEMVAGTSAASGGGSGGGVLLEAPRMEFVSGSFVSANGGGGGCANTSGTSGLMSEARAPGATCNAPSGNGGDGGSEDNQNADNGTDGSGNGASGGGGGGGIGRIRGNLAIGEILPQAFFSPRPSNGNIGTR